MTYAPTSEQYWQVRDLDQEIRRVFDICHNCRMCFNLCPAFPHLFDSVDAHDGEIARVPARDLDRFVDLCYQCKLCFIQCPYTPPHEWMVDIPRVALRHKAQRARETGVTLQDRALGHVDVVGPLGAATAPLANRGNRLAPARWLLHHTVGVHKDRLLPLFYRETFARWWARSREGRPAPPAAPPKKVALFYTCSVNYNGPAVGRAAVQVLDHHGVEIVCPEQRCCGMPFLDGGDMEAAQENVAANTKTLLAAVDAGYTVVVPGPTCSYMLKREYPVILPGADTRRVAENTLDLCEYLMALHAQGLLRTDFARGAGRVAYHLPCHLKAQNIGYKSRDLLALLPGTRVTLVERCSGMDGTWGMKREFFPLSMQVAQKLFREVEEVAPEIVATDCPLAALQITQGTGLIPRHPVEILRDAYGLPAAA